MQFRTRLIPPKWLALSLWIVFFTVTVLAFLTWNFSPRTYHFESVPEADDGVALNNAKRLDLAAAELSTVATRLAEAPRSRQPQTLLPEVPVRKEQRETMLVANTLVVQSGNRLVVYLNGQPITKGTRLPSGDVVVNLSPRAITLADPSGARRSISLGAGLSTPPASDSLPKPPATEKGELK